MFDSITFYDKSLSLLCGWRYSWGNAEGCGENQDLPECYLQEQVFIQGQDCSWCWSWNRNTIPLLCKSWSKTCLCCKYFVFCHIIQINIQMLFIFSSNISITPLVSRLSAHKWLTWQKRLLKQMVFQMVNMSRSYIF